MKKKKPIFPPDRIVVESSLGSLPLVVIIVAVAFIFFLLFTHAS